VGAKYVNEKKGFQSRFLTFETGARLELMHSAHMDPPPQMAAQQGLGLSHFAIAVGSQEGVDVLADRLRTDGFEIVDGPRRTGDGYYEAVVLDPDGNRIEIAS
jgi:lactoylglutathione lyase